MPNFRTNRIRQPAHSRKAAPGLIVAAVLLTGCSGGEKKEGLVEACGTVTLDGEPLVDAQVTFDHPLHPETFGRTDSNGYYEMSYTATQEGAFAGENVVSFMTADGEAKPEERVPRQYLYGKSELRVNVTEEGGPYDFELKSTGGEANTVSSQ